MARVVHFELPAENPERAVTSCRNGLGWDIQKWDEPIDYWLVRTGPEDKPGVNGAVMRREGPHAVVRRTVDVTSIDDTIAAVTAAGGRIVQPKTPVLGVDWHVYFEDTEDNLMGAMQSDAGASF